jgi:hypothetical protein
MRRSFTALFVLLVFDVVPVDGREWKDATGRHSIEAEFVDAKVSLKMPDGRVRVIGLEKLSEADRQFIVDSLRSGGGETPAATGSTETAAATPEQMQALYEKLGNALNQDDEKTVRATTKAIYAADKTCQDLQSAVLNQGEQPQRAVWILSEIGREVPWRLEALLNMEETAYQNLSRYGRGAHFWYNINAFTNQTLAAPVNASLAPSRDFARMLAEYGDDPRVAELYASALSDVKGAPEPADRAKAALRLSRATLVADEAIPALVSALKSDASPEVQLAAAASLAGFGGEARAAAAEIVERAEAKNMEENQTLYLVALSEIDTRGGQLRKVITKLLTGYKRSEEDRNAVHPVCTVFKVLGPKGNWGIPAMLEVAETSLNAEGREVEFHRISEALGRIGSGDPRVVRFYEKAAKDGPERYRVYCDSAAKQLKLRTAR